MASVYAPQALGHDVAVLRNHGVMVSFWVLTTTPGAEAACGFPSHDACTE